MILNQGDSAFARIMKHVRASNLTAFGVRIEENRYEIMAAWIDAMMLEGHDRVVVYLSMSKWFSMFETIRNDYKDRITIVDATGMSYDELFDDMKKKCSYGNALFFIDVLWAFSFHESAAVMNYAMDTIRMKKFAMANDISIIVNKFMSCYMYQREGLHDDTPLLRDFEGEDYLASISDCVISLYTPSKLNIFVDERGNDLRDVTFFKVLKSPISAPFDIKTRKLSIWDYMILPDEEESNFP